MKTQLPLANSGCLSSSKPSRAKGGRRRRYEFTVGELRVVDPVIPGDLCSKHPRHGDAGAAAPRKDLAPLGAVAASACRRSPKETPAVPKETRCEKSINPTHQYVGIYRVSLWIRY